jgi:hypothetical protein
MDGSTGIRKYADAAGLTRLWLRRGGARPGFTQPPTAQYVDTKGFRVDRHGRRVRATQAENFREIAWNLPEPEGTEPEPPPAAPPTLADAIALADGSPLFKKTLDALAREGWGIAVDPSAKAPACALGPCSITLDLPRRSILAARLVHEVGLARALTGAPLPAIDPAQPTFVRENALALLDRHGEAKLFHALVRDEVLAYGGPDIGGPGLRGDQALGYRYFRTGAISRDAALASISRSVDAEELRGFDRELGPVVAQHLDAAFVSGTPMPARPGNAFLETLDRVRALPAFDQTTVAAALRAKLVARPGLRPHQEVFGAKLLGGPFADVELRQPVYEKPGVQRLVLVPSKGFSFDSVAAWYGRGQPHHLGARATDDLATVAYGDGPRWLFATFSVTSGELAAIAFQPV